MDTRFAPEELAYLAGLDTMPCSTPVDQAVHIRGHWVTVARDYHTRLAAWLAPCIVRGCDVAVHRRGDWFYIRHGEAVVRCDDEWWRHGNTTATDVDDWLTAIHEREGAVAIA